MTSHRENYEGATQAFTEAFGPGGRGVKQFWRDPFGLLVYLHASLVSLPPLFVLFWLGNEGWYRVTAKVIAGLWLALVLLVHLVLAIDSDQAFGPTYRRNRAMYTFNMLCVGLMLWNPNRIVFFIALGGFLYFSVCYVLLMQAVRAQYEERSQSRSGASQTAPPLKSE